LVKAVIYNLRWIGNILSMNVIGEYLGIHLTSFLQIFDLPGGFLLISRELFPAKLFCRLNIDIEIYKLTNSIKNIITGDSFSTDIILVDHNDLKWVSKKNDWLFDWRSELKGQIRTSLNLQFLTIRVLFRALKAICHSFPRLL
jgi:hypothetical protein